MIEYTSVGQFNHVKGVTLINATEAKEMHDRGAVFVHTEASWFKRRIPGSHFLEWGWGEGWLFNEVSLGRIANADTEIVIYSHDLKGKRTAQAAAFAVSRGFKNVYQFPGGVDAWEAAGYQLEKLD